MKSKIIIFFSILLSSIQLFSQSVTLQNNKGEPVELYKESYALIIGASNYNNGWPVLAGVMKDIAEIKDILEDQGFSVTTVIDPNLMELRDAYRNFINKHGLDAENRLLIYFAGHGHTIRTAYGEEMGYIVPVDAPNPNKDKNAFLSNSMAMQQIEVFAKQIQSKHALFLFDACFSGSIFAISRAIPENISYKTAKPVRQFITSGSADETVPDESVFRSQFVAALQGEADVNEDGFVTGTELGEFLQEKVVNYSKGSQHPQYGKIRNPHLDKGDFVFVSLYSEDLDITAANTSSGTITKSRSEEADVSSVNTSAAAAYTVIQDELLEDRIKDIPEIFSLVALKTPNELFVCAEGGGGGVVVADRDGAAVWETFQLIPTEDNKYSFKTYNGNFLNISPDGKIIEASSNEINAQTSFELIELEANKYALKADNELYVCALDGGDGPLVPTSKLVRAHEVFTFVFMNSFGIKSHNGQYASCNSEKIEFTGNEPEIGNVFRFQKISSDEIVILAPNGNYLSVDAKAGRANSKIIDKSCVFRIEYENQKIRLLTKDGKYVTAIGGGGFSLRARKTDAGDWETFSLYPLHIIR